MAAIKGLVSLAEAIEFHRSEAVDPILRRFFDVAQLCLCGCLPAATAKR